MVLLHAQFRVQPRSLVLRDLHLKMLHLGLLVDAFGLQLRDDLLQAVDLLVELLKLFRLIPGVRLQLGNPLFSCLHLVLDLLHQTWCVR